MSRPLVAAQPKPKPKHSKYTLQRKLEAAEKEIEQANDALARIDAALADPELFTRDRARGELLLKERAHAATALARAEAAWLEASEGWRGDPWTVGALAGMAQAIFPSALRTVSTI